MTVTIPRAAPVAAGDRVPRRASRSGRTRPGTATIVAVALAAPLAFIALHVVLELRSNHTLFVYLAARSDPAHALAAIVSIWPGVWAGLLAFAGAELSGVALAARGRVGTFALPAAIASLGPGLAGNLDLWMHLPAAFGPGWGNRMAIVRQVSGAGRALWIGALVDLALAMAPAALLATGHAGRPVAHRSTVSIDLRVGATTFSLLILWLIVSSQLADQPPQVPWALAPATVSLVLFGMLLGTSRAARRWRWTAIAVPALMMTGWTGAVPTSGSSAVGAAIAALPWIAVTTVGLMVEPLAALLDRLRNRTVLLVVAINAMNLVDAVLSSIEVRHLGAVESNPVIGAIGLPAKILLVALLTAILARRRPRALVWPALAMVGVLAWHVAGLVQNARVA